MSREAAACLCCLCVPVPLAHSVLFSVPMCLCHVWLFG